MANRPAPALTLVMGIAPICQRTVNPPIAPPPIAPARYNFLYASSSGALARQRRDSHRGTGLAVHVTGPRVVVYAL